MTVSDINECSNGTLNQCTNKNMCVNTNGSYECRCPIGQELDNDRRSCSGRHIVFLLRLCFNSKFSIDNYKIMLVLITIYIARLRNINSHLII